MNRNYENLVDGLRAEVIEVAEPDNPVYVLHISVANLAYENRETAEGLATDLNEMFAVIAEGVLDESDKT